jgi:hypothetical protein
MLGSNPLNFALKARRIKNLLTPLNSSIEPLKKEKVKHIEVVY